MPSSLVLGWLIRTHGVYWAGWVLAAAAGVQALLLTASTRRQEAPSGPPGGEEEDVTDGGEGVPGDIACRELVALVTNYLDGVLPSGWRAGLDRHLADCDGAPLTSSRYAPPLTR